MDTKALTRASSYPWYRLRESSYDELYVSPHMDDAIYSCGGQIALQRAAGKRILIVTVFGNGDDDPRSPANTASGQGVFSDYAQRKREERAAIELLDVDHLWLNLPDLLVRQKPIADLVRYAIPFVALAPSELQARLLATIAALCRTLLGPRGLVFFPLAVGAHPDHRIVHHVGRALATQREAVWFYEDVPYAQVPALRDDRLRHLGLPRPGSALRAAREAHAFAFAHSPSWQRPLTLFLVAGHTLFTRALFAWWPAKPRQLQPQDLVELQIDSVIDRKVEAMRAYETQTAFFFPGGDAIYKALSRSGPHYVERYWQLRPDPTAPRMDGTKYAAQEQARAASLKRE